MFQETSTRERARDAGIDPFPPPLPIRNEPSNLAKEEMMSAEAHLNEHGISLPQRPPPVGNYIGAVTVGNLVFLSGHGPRKPDDTFITGNVGRDLNLEEAQAAARLVGLNSLATLKAEIGSLEWVKRVVKVLGMVNAVPEFEDHPQSDQRFYRLNGRGVRRFWSQRPLRGGHELAPLPDCRRGRDDCRADLSKAIAKGRGTLR